MFTQLQYGGGNWDPEPTAAASLMSALKSSTSIDASPQRALTTLGSPDLFSSPFLYMAGNDDFQQFQDDEIDNLRKYLKSGGMLVGDDCVGVPGYGFDSAFRREMHRVFPGEKMTRLPHEHTVFRSFYIIRGMGGRKIVSPFLEGVTLGSKTPVIYCPNGLGGAWAREPTGRWIHEVAPGGERQRKLSFQIGINIVMYALCADYKQDLIHQPFLRRKI